MAGFTALRTQADSDWGGKLETYSVLSSVDIIAPGDPVIIQGTGDSTGRSVVQRATSAATAITGIVASVEPQFVGENLNGTGLAIGDDGKVHVHISQDTVFIVDIQDGAGAAAVLTTASINLNIAMDLTDSTGPNGLTISNAAVDEGTQLGTATLPFRIIGLADPDPATPTNFRKAIVRINASTIKNGVTGV
jgi:hypothetical protein